MTESNSTELDCDATLPTQEPEEKDRYTNNAIYVSVKKFRDSVEGLLEMIPLLALIAAGTKNTREKEYSDFLKENGKLINTEGSSRTYELDTSLHGTAQRLESRCNRSKSGYKLLSRHFVVSFVSEYDSFLGNLIKSIYALKPELLNDSERNLSFAELTKFSSIEEARNYILEKEIESVLRKSHSDQFKWLENKFNTPLNKGLDSWAKFIEITERRNLFVHCNGIVSTQYLSTCKDQNVTLPPNIKMGEELDAPRAYLAESYDTLYEIGIKLSQVLWRKLFPQELDLADRNLSEISYDLLCNEKYSLAIKLLDFACLTLKSWSDDRMKKMFIINRAQAYKHNGDTEKCRQIIAENDWSSCQDDFQICVAALKEDYDTLEHYMKKHINDDLMKDSYYLDWPIFKEYRTTDRFKSNFKAVFNIDVEKIVVDEQKTFPIPSENVYLKNIAFKEKQIPANEK